jgi:hypothetical protein
MLALPQLAGAVCGRRERSRRLGRRRFGRGPILGFVDNREFHRSARSKADRLATSSNVVGAAFGVPRDIASGPLVCDEWIPASAPTNRNARDLAQVCRSPIRRWNRRRADGRGRTAGCRRGARRLCRGIWYLTRQYQR